MQSVTLHTDLGDIKIELQCELVPRACEVHLLYRTAKCIPKLDRSLFPNRISLLYVPVVTTMTVSYTGVIKMRNLYNILYYALQVSCPVEEVNIGSGSQVT